MNVKIAVVSLQAEDVELVVHFYRDVIGLKLAVIHPGHKPCFDLQGVYLVICKGHTKTAKSGKVDQFPLIAFSVEDLDKAIQHLEHHQVSLPWGIEKDFSSRWVKLFDPAGNLIELVEWKSEIKNGSD
jgi:predicted enzyme related to lactoylglutathione lyase